MVFRPERIANGLEGGKIAARDLARQIQEEIGTCYNHDVESLQTWIWIFFNRRGLLGALTRDVDHSYVASYPIKFDQFIQGFNISSSNSISSIAVHSKRQPTTR